MNFENLFYLDETSPSYLRWKIPINNRTKINSTAGYLNSHGYWSVRFKGKTYPVHTIVYYLYYGIYDFTKTIDHLDNCPSNNNPLNLKLATKSEQSKNRRAWGFKTINNKLNAFEIAKANKL